MVSASKSTHILGHGLVPLAEVMYRVEGVGNEKPREVFGKSSLLSVEHDCADIGPSDVPPSWSLYLPNEPRVSGSVRDQTEPQVVAQDDKDRQDQLPQGRGRSGCSRQSLTKATRTTGQRGS
jgi:hypothetical protein